MFSELPSLTGRGGGGGGGSAEASQLPFEDAGSGEEGGRKDLKRRGFEAESCLVPKRRSTRVRAKQLEPTVRFGTLQKYIPPCLR